jgi:hypothetical protein
VGTRMFRYRHDAMGVTRRVICIVNIIKELAEVTLWRKEVVKICWREGELTQSFIAWVVLLYKYSNS